MKADEILEQVADRWAARDGYDPGSAVYLKDTRFMARTIAEELGVTAECDCHYACTDDLCSHCVRNANAARLLLAMGEANG